MNFLHRYLKCDVVGINVRSSGNYISLNDGIHCEGEIIKEDGRLAMRSVGMNVSEITMISSQFSEIYIVKKNLLQVTRLVSSVQDNNDSVESDAIKNLKKSFAYNINHIEKQFGKYIAKADHNGLSLDNFWHKYFGAKYANSCSTTSPTNNIAQITTEIKIEDPIDIIDEVDEDELYSSDFESTSSDDFNVDFEVEK